MQVETKSSDFRFRLVQAGLAAVMATACTERPDAQRPSAAETTQTSTQALTPATYTCNGTNDDALITVVNSLASNTVLTITPGTCLIGVNQAPNLVLSNSLRNVRIEATGVTIHPAQVPTQTLFEVPELFYISNTSGITINGLAIDLSGVAARGIVAYYPNTNVTISNCEISNSIGNGDAIFLAGNTGSRIVNNRISNVNIGIYAGNTNAGLQETNPFISGNDVGHCRNDSIAGVMDSGLVSGNTVHDSVGWDGINVSSYSATPQSNLAIVGNYVFGNGGHGIQSDTSTTTTDGVTVSGNVIERNGASGIYCNRCANWTITGNVIKNNATSNSANPAVVLVQASGVTIVGNQIYANGAQPGQTGVYLNEADAAGGTSITDISIAANRISGFSRGGVWLDTGSTANSIARVGVSTNAISGASYGLYANGLVTGLSVSNNVLTANAQDLFIAGGVDAVGANNVYTTGTALATRYGANHILPPGLAAPTGSCTAGDIRYNSAAASGSTAGWICGPTGWLALANVP
jgi:parallel beta-helix repeat protein